MKIAPRPATHREPLIFPSRSGAFSFLAGMQTAESTAGCDRRSGPGLLQTIRRATMSGVACVFLLAAAGLSGTTPAHAIPPPPPRPETVVDLRAATSAGYLTLPVTVSEGP